MERWVAPFGWGGVGLLGGLFVLAVQASGAPWERLDSEGGWLPPTDSSLESPAENGGVRG